jgi:hypothetical protein
MAFSVQLTVYAAASGLPVLTLEPLWWSAAVLRTDPRFTATIMDGYLDLSADLTVEEARALHERFVPATQRKAGFCGPGTFRSLHR